MRGVDYIVRKAEELKKPVVINISFGNTYGSHDGTSLLERYLNTVSERWKNVICVGSGNEGTTAGHAAGEYRKGMMTEVQLAVQQREKSFSLQIWKSYVDEVTITIVDPSGNHSGRLEEKKEHKEYRSVKQNSWFTMESQNHIVFVRKFILVFYHEMNLSQPECGKYR